MENRCPSCGETLPPQAVRFCVACGKILPGDGEPPAPAASTTVAAADRGRRRRRRPLLAWIVATAAFVALAAGGSAALVLGNHRGRAVSLKTGVASHVPHNAPSTASPPSAERAELAQITPLVWANVAARSAVTKATQQAGACTITPADGITLMDQAIRERQAVADRIGTLSVDAIPGGQQMLGYLRQATEQSIVADQGFIGWMQDMQNAAACPIDTSQDTSYQAGLQASAQAVQAKQEFTALWNPLASSLGQPAFTADGI